MADMTARVDVDLGGNLPANAPRWNRAFGQMARGIRASAPVLSAAAAQVSAGIDRMGNRYVALATGAGGVGALRFLGNMDERLRGLAVQSNQPIARIDALKDKIYAVANAPEIRINPAGLLDAVDKIVEKTGDLDLAEDNLRNIGLTMRAAGAEGRDVGATIADLSEKLKIKGAADMNRALDTWVNQGKAGAFTMENMAGSSERVNAAFGRLGRTGMQGVREVGAAMQVIRKGTGSAEQAATGIEALIRTLSDAEKIKLLKGAGIQLVDPEDPKRMRSLDAILQDIFTRADATSKNAEEFNSKLSGIFDSEAMRAVAVAAQEFRETGGLGSFKKFMEVDDSGVSLLKDAEFRAKGLNAAVRSLRTSMEGRLEANLAEPVQDLADAIDGLDPKTIDATMDALGKGALAVGGIILLNKALRVGFGIARGIGGMRGGGGRGLAGAAAAAAAQPVFVTNWPAGVGIAGGPGGGRYTKTGRRVPSYAGTATTTAAAGGAGVLSRAAAFGKGALGRAGLPLLALISAPELIGAVARGDGESAAGVGGRLAGAAGGAALGAALGSLVPVLGNLAGALAGA
ncbi:MAG: tail tape measure protein, partial [Magnetovibrio sp.]|nr:tail tape measure protein [Magnetovibrio sp.]